MNKKQESTRRQLEQAQAEAVKAMRRSDQKALDKASDKAVAAFAKIANK